ncbi:hypothetical protein P154DRAFT_624461 [Amniculicola lignicola CBS 123094]|uniref:RBR-type E3 ubiquitin transferase n=1 Tax=Amniculicola lignicola CBS 123094 TaxID=1392246 RepID=A0A6A5W1D4_9PLEO|nr:hypothetical protein P154DRAFT_624461 [Amniculicola lignicola CBS 123094]
MDRSVEEYEPGWSRDLWQSNVAAERSSAFFRRLSCDIERLQERLQTLPLDGRDAGAPRRDSVLAEDFEGRPVIDSYGSLRQWLSSAMPEHNPAIDSLCQSQQHFQSWAAPFMEKPNYFTVDQTDFRYLCKMLLDSDRTLEEDCHRRFLQVESMRKDYIRLCTTNSQPNTLRSIIALRIMKISEKSNRPGETKNILRADVETLDPIPAGILDITLSSNQVGVIGQVLPQISDAKTRELYRGICIKACAFCRKPKFHVLDTDVHPLLRNLTEFPRDAPRDNCAYQRQVCSSCRFTWLIRDICQEWWHNLAYHTWLKPRCNQRCSKHRSLSRTRDVGAYILQFNSIDSGDLRRCMNMYRQVLQYRHALQKLKPQPEPRDLAVAQRLLNRFLDVGLMHNFVQLDTTTETLKIAQYMTVIHEHERLRASPDLTYQVPIFLNLFKRQNIPKECIVCAEDKFEIDYDSWLQWNQAWGEFRSPWMWTVLEYPVSEHQRCTHPLDVCRLCIAKHIAISLGNGNFERITCPQCDRGLAYDEIKNLCPEETFKMYDKRVLLHTLGKLPNFRWCLAPHCENGQVYDDIDPMSPVVQCQECDFKMCFYHGLPWHNSLTCDEFDSSLTHGDPKYQETQAIIENNTKGCPNCDVRIEKGSGCFHMTCFSCKHEFCWECLVSWQLVKANRVNHYPGCYFRSSDLTPTAITGIDLRTALQWRG